MVSAASWLAGTGRATLAASGPRGLAALNPAIPAVLDSADRILHEVGYLEPIYLTPGNSGARPKLHLTANIFLSREASEALTGVPEWGSVAREYVRYLGRQSGPIEGRPDARTAAAGFTAPVKALVASAGRNVAPGTGERAMACFTIGSVNTDYRSMVMDGEAMLTLTGLSSLTGVIDFTMLEGLTAWIDAQAELDALLPPPGGLTRKMADLRKLAR